MRQDVSKMSEAELAKAEKEIARKYIGGVPWMMVVWGLGNFVVWLTLWPLVMTGVMPLWAGFLVACLNMSLAYLPSHEAQHSNIAKEGHPLRWLNELVGHVSTLPVAYPYSILRITHMLHHAHTNDPEKDPDFNNNAPTWYQSVWHTVESYQPGYVDPYAVILQKREGDPIADRALTEAVLYKLGMVLALITLAWSGYALEAFLLWWLPSKIGIAYLKLCLSWAPHVPFAEQGRYRNTRAWRFFGGMGIWNVLTMGMQYHIVHHLHPAIPLFRNGPAYWEMRDILIARGIPNDGL